MVHLNFTCMGLTACLFILYMQFLEKRPYCYNYVHDILIAQSVLKTFIQEYGKCK